MIIDKIISIAKQRYENGELLSNRGLKAFLIPLKFLNQFCSNENILDEYKQHRVKMSIQKISRNEEVTKELARIKDVCEERYKRSKKYWDLQPTTLDQEITKYSHTEPGKYEELLMCCESEVKPLIEQDLELFKGIHYKDYTESKIEDRAKLCITLALDQLSSYGIQLVKKRAKKRPVFSIPLEDDITLIFELDIVNLNTKYGSPAIIQGSGRQIRSGPRVIESLLLYNTTSNERIGGFSLSDLFPITALYSDFFSLGELEAVLNIRLFMLKWFLEEVLKK